MDTENQILHKYFDIFYNIMFHMYFIIVFEIIFYFHYIVSIERDIITHFLVSFVDQYAQYFTYFLSIASMNDKSLMYDNILCQGLDELDDSINNKLYLECINFIYIINYI
jgi:hypothetical protein